VFGIGLPELLFILALALIVLGPERLPKVARQLARLLGELKKAGEDFKNQLDLEGLKDIKDSVSKAKSYPQNVGGLETADIKRRVGNTNAGRNGRTDGEPEPESKAAGKDEDAEGLEIQLHGGGESRPAELEEGKSDTVTEPHESGPHSDVS
jgi:Tat protein translocase TatB subunit